MCAFWLNIEITQIFYSATFRYTFTQSRLDLSLISQLPTANTGKSFSEALILVSTNPQYDQKLFTDLPVQYKKTTSSEHVVYINCFECQNKTNKQFMYTTCSELVVFMYWSDKPMNNILSYCGLVDARKIYLYQRRNKMGTF